MLSRSIVAAQLNGNPFGVRGAWLPVFFDVDNGGLRFLKARCADSVVPARVVEGVVRRRVVLIARDGQPDGVLRVVQIDARYAGVGACRCGRRMRVAPQMTATGAPNTPMQPTAARARSLAF